MNNQKDWSGFNEFEKVQVKKSKDKNVLKFVFEKSTAVAEAVLYKYPTYKERTVICCSTMSGCPIGCRFCGAGDYFVRKLTAQEIVAQVDYLIEKQVEPSEVISAFQIERFQIMFMSMGEPMLNLEETSKALRVLYKKYPNAKLLISTSAPKADYKAFAELSKEIPTIGLQFSVHESTDEARDTLVPFKGKLTLKQIAKEGEYWRNEVDDGRKPFFNYCAHDKNTSQEDADRIFDLFDPMVWEATISVICERDESIAAANERQRELAFNFMQKLNIKGFSTRMFDPAGQDDIGGGCGQLWFVQSWMQNHKDKTKKTIGYGKEIVHAPGV